MMFKKLSLTVLLFAMLQPFAWADTNEPKQLIFAIDLIRHGDRTPLVELPKSPHVWPEGLGALTSEGVQQEKHLGEQLRKRYIDDEKLLTKQFDANAIAIRSTSIERTKLSAKALMSGLYPGAEVSIASVPQKNDELLMVKPSFNPLILASFLVQTENIWEKLIAPLKPQLPALQEKTGLNIYSFKQFGRLADNLYIRYLHHVPFPEGIDDATAKQIMLAAEAMMVAEYRLKELTDPMGRTFLNVVNEQLQQAANKPGQLKYILFSAHDSSIMAVMNTMDTPMQQIPPYASHLNFALYRQQQKVFVEITLNDEPVPVPACGGYRCELDQFAQMGKSVHL